MNRILLLDDVQKEGREVVGFTEEADALAYARRHKINLAVLDIKLKKMSGIQVLEELKKISPDMDAIILTAYPSRQTVLEARRFGVSEYCVKPIDNDTLEEKVSKLLAMQQQ
jgi:DNA-binding NarL/FixJ family response regulator